MIKGKKRIKRINGGHDEQVAKQSLPASGQGFAFLLEHKAKRALQLCSAFLFALSRTRAEWYWLDGRVGQYAALLLYLVIRRRSIFCSGVAKIGFGRRDDQPF